MDNNKQQILLEYLISSPDTFATCQGMVNSEFFDPEFRNAVSFIKSYYDKYNTTPDPAQVKAETGVQLSRQEIKEDKIKWCSTEVETFCRHRAMEKAILSSVEDVNNGRLESVEARVREALLISLNRDMGVRYFEDPNTRLQRMLQSSSTMSTGWPSVDELLFGGISRKELLLVSANSGGGKSIVLANLAVNFCEQGYNVLYVSLELSEDVIAQRFDTMFTGIGRKEWKTRVDEIAHQVTEAGHNKGHIDIKQFPVGTSANTIHAYLKEYYLKFGYMPDLVVIDYVDLMHPNEKNVSLSDLWTKDKLCSEQARDIGVRHNLAVATASQLNRSAVNATQQSHDQIAGGISKINTTDVYWSILMNETMRAKNEVAFHFQKTRNSDGVGKTVYLTWEGKRLRILDKKDQSSPLTLNKKVKDKSQGLRESLLGNTPDGEGLLGLMSATK